MTRGPDKQFVPEDSLEKAMGVFWAKGYAAASLAELLEAMGIGRKSMYDTFGNKRDLYRKALAHYSSFVSRRFNDDLNDPDHRALDNVRRMLRNLEQLNAQPMSMGCLLGVGMAQCNTDDVEMASALRAHLKGTEEAFFRAFERAQEQGDLKPDTNVRDLARLFLSTTQGLALLGRVTENPDLPRSIVDAALATLEALGGMGESPSGQAPRSTICTS